MNKNKSTLIFIFLFIIGLILSIGYIISTNQQDNQVYETQSPFRFLLETKSILTGEIEAKDQAEIKPNISGIIGSLYVKEGQLVGRGDLLATVDVIANVGEVSGAKSKISSDNILLENEKRNFNRVKQLFEQGVLPKIEYEKAETAFRIAQQNVISAQKQLQVAQTGVVSGASNNQIRATIGGVITELLIEKGSQVIGSSSFHTGTTVATIADLSVLLFRGKVDEIEAGRLKIGMPISITIGAIEDKKFEAILTFISPKGTQENGSVQFDVEAEMKLKPQDNVRIGYSANAEITYGKAKEALVINEALVQYDQMGNPFVEIKTEGNKFSKKNIQLGMSDGINIEVLSGVNETDKIKVWNKSNKPNQPVLKRPNKEY
jgi:HlyD family secretion protein